MFGRRNSEPPSAPSPKPPEDTIDLDMLPELPEIPSLPAQSPIQQEQASNDHFSNGEQTSVAPYQPNIPEPTPFLSSLQMVSRPKNVVESVIGPDDFFDGNYRSERGVRLQGTVRGSIESRQYIFVEAGARVEANLMAEDITVSGEFRGKIECRHRLEITSSGHVHGDVTTALLVVHEGGLLDGQLHMQPEA